MDREFAGGAVESGSDQRDEYRGEDDTESDEDRGREREQGKDGFGELRGFFIAVLGAKAGVDRDERSGEYTFAKKILQEVRDTQRCAAGAGDFGSSEEAGLEVDTDQPRDSAEENSRG